jgi:uncharacterized membrane protein
MTVTHENAARADLSPASGGSARFDTILAHLFRGEMHRMTTWRQRLDTTSNWAVVLSLGMTTFALGSDRTPPYVLLLGLAAAAMCMLIEARRYQHLHHSAWRLRLIEAHYYVGVLRPGNGPDPRWRDELAADLAEPCLKIGMLKAVRARLRRNYLMLMLFITAAWLAKVFIHPASPSSVEEFYRRLAVGDLVPSWVVAASATTFVISATVLALTSPKQESLEGWARGKGRSVCSDDRSSARLPD